MTEIENFYGLKIEMPTVDKMTAELNALRTCLEAVKTILIANEKAMGISDNGDYPYQMEILLDLCFRKTENVIDGFQTAEQINTRK